MERYSTYKDSGIQWLGEIPSHWKVVPFKNIANIILGKMLENAPEGQGDKYLCAKDVHMNSINYDDLKLMKFSPEEKKKYAIQKGDMLVVEGGASGSSAIVNKDVKNVYIQNSLMIVRCGENVAYNPFASYMLNSMVNRGYAESVCNKATIMHFTKEKLGATLIAFPPLPEQQAIAEYLDTITSKIDTAIAQQQKMIDLLNERKQIIINNAVTKGLNPNVKMKDSGVDWIGEIPEHWEVNKLKNCAKTNSGSTPRSIAGKENPSSTIRWVRTTDLHNNVVEDTSEYISEKEMASASCPWLPKNTVLISMYGGAGSFGKVGLLNIEATINQALCSINSNSSVLPKYIFYFLQSAHRIWMKYAASSRKDPNLNQEIIRNLDLVIPPLAEQERIIVSIEEKLESLRTVLDCSEKQISLLQERKQIIINEVVTGKVKVC